MSNLLLNVAQVSPVIALSAPTQTKEFNEKEEFKTLNFLAENASIFIETLETFKSVKTISEQKEILKSLSKEKQLAISNFFKKLHANSKKMNKISKNGIQSRIRVDSAWHWFGVWNLTFTKAESELIKNILWAGSSGAEFGFTLSSLLPLPPVIAPILGILGIFLGGTAFTIDALMALSKYGNFYIAFYGVVPVAISPGWNDGR